jgi:hypothetical protein
MIKGLLFFLTILQASLSACAQNQPMIKFYTEKKVLNAFYKLEKSGSKDNYTLSDFKNGDTLNLKVDGYENIILKFTFKLEGGYCDYQSLEFSCDSCTQKHQEEIFNLKYCGWKKLSEDKYLSKYQVQTEMQITKTDNMCSKIIYRYVDKPKKIYKTEYNALKEGILNL